LVCLFDSLCLPKVDWFCFSLLFTMSSVFPWTRSFASCDNRKGGGVNNTKDFFFSFPPSYSLCHVWVCVCVCLWGEFLQLVTKISGCANDKKDFFFLCFSMLLTMSSVLFLGGGCEFLHPVTKKRWRCVKYKCLVCFFNFGFNFHIPYKKKWRC
jgi:hypothetical protein